MAKQPQVFFTADTHFNHRAMVGPAGWRSGFSTVAEMNEALITYWNETVRPQDIVWHLGDVFMSSPMVGLPLISELHGQIHLIAGNHDRCWPGFRDSHKWQRAFLDAGFESVQAFARRSVGGRSVMLSHLPYVGDHYDADRFENFRLRDMGDPLLCGHVHTAWEKEGRQFNVGVDVHDFRPVHVDEVGEWVGTLPL